jgi:hypothetical protein
VGPFSLVDDFFRVAVKGGGAAVKAARGLRGPAGTAAKVGIGLAAADLVLVPAAEQVSGRDIQAFGLDFGTLTREAVAGAGQSIGQVVGQTETAATRGFAEGGLRGLLGTSDAQSSQFVTIAILAIGAVLLFRVVSD